jgi:hypothetical protein
MNENEWEISAIVMKIYGEYDSSHLRVEFSRTILLLFRYSTAIFEITISLNTHAKNFKSCVKTVS